MHEASNNTEEGETAKSACCSGHNHTGHDHSSHSQHDHHAHSAAAVRDPVCGMTVDPATAKHRFAYKGQDYFFCSDRCRTRFEGEPEKYLAPKSTAPEETLPEGTIYT